MRVVVLAWVPLLAGMQLSCSASRLQPREPTPGRPHLTVMSYNVNFGIACDPATLQTIASTPADAVFLQETNEPWEQCLRERMSSTHPHIAFRHEPAAGGLAVLSRIPFEQRDFVPSPIGWFPGWRVVLQSELGKVQVLQVHLRPQVSDNGSYVSGYLSTGHYRLAEIRQYAPTLEPGMPAIVLGDFNEKGGKAIGHLEQLGLRDVLDDFDLGSTWRWNTSVGTLRLQLDHVFYRGNLSPLRAEVLQAGNSDHLPVLVAFEGS